MHTTIKEGSRLRKFIPQPKEYASRYGGFQITPRDLDILEVVYRYRHLESRHIRALIAGSDQQITRRLHGLFHNKYVARYVPLSSMRLRLGEGSPVIAYGLDTNGHHALEAHLKKRAEEDGAEFDGVQWRKEYTRRKEWHLLHHLGVSNFHCVLETALRGHQELDLWEWDQSVDSRAEVKLSGGVTYRINPDAYFAIDAGGRLRHCFLEFDRSSEEHHRIREKYTKYWWYLQSDGYREAHDDPQAVNVLFVTTGERRMENMIRTLQEMPKPNNAKWHGGKGIFWFALDTEYQLSDPGSILKPLWRSITRIELQGLV